MNAEDLAYGPWHTWWAVWFAASFASFLGVEIYALLTDYRRTLSAAVWYLEDFIPGQPIGHWSAGHFWFIAIMGTLFAWLLGHFGLGWWR